MTKIITHKLLKSWSPCIDGYKRYCELFPKGADLSTAISGLVADGHDSWGKWLFDKCREKELFKEVVVLGYSNSGDWNSGNRNSGYWNSGNWNSGDSNSGDRNSGYWNSGDWNSGNRNSGYWNSGNWNSGDRNSGDWNSGNWNSGNRNSGYFNSKTPDTILVFDKPCKRDKWDKADKPSFIFFDLTYWVSESEMTDADKKADPNFYVRGGQLRKRDYKEAWQLAYSKASKQDIANLKKLPNFNAKVFEQISGIKV